MTETRPPMGLHREPDPPRPSRRRGRIAGMIVGIAMMAAGGVAIIAVLGPSHRSATGAPPVAGQTTAASPGVLPITPTASVRSGSPSADPSPSGSPSTSAPSGSASPAPEPVPPPAPTGSPKPSRSPPPAPTPTVSVGMVDVRAVSGNPHVLTVGGLYNSYFSGINAKQYAQVLALYDPAGALNPNDPVQAANFTHGVSTTVDGQAVLWSISDDAVNAGDLDTRITFQSQQQTGFGPADAPSETCTLWDNTYELHPAGDGSYRILELLQFTDHPC